MAEEQTQNKERPDLGAAFIATNKKLHNLMICQEQ